MPDDSPPLKRRARTPLEPHAGADLDEEIRFHLDMRADEYAMEGAGPDEARRRALRKFGDLSGIRAETLSIDQRLRRRAARADTMTALLQDFRYALRNLRMSPGFSAMVAVTLALGIGTTTIMFSVVDGVVLRPLPYPAPERLVSLGDVQGSEDETPNSYPEYLDWKERAGDTFSEVASWFQAGGSLTGAGEPERLLGERMSTNLPALLGVQPLVGRLFQQDDELTGSARVMMLSEALWRRRFHSDPAIVGRVLTINATPHTVIGVFPSTPRSRLPNELASGRPTDYWAPLRLTPENAPRGLHFMFAMGRLRNDVELSQARVRLDALTAGLRRDSVTTHSIRARPLVERIIGDTGGLLTLLVTSVSMLLLIACANVANLLLARGAARTREFGIRGALGASRGRILGQLLAESVVRALAGGVLGIGVAYAGMWAVRRWLTVTLPRFETVTIDSRVLAFAVVLSVVTGLAFGLVPGLRASRTSPGGALREGGRGVFGSIRRDRFRRALVVGEVALSFVLLVAAGLLIKSFGRLLDAPLGFQPDRLLTAFVSLPARKYADSTSQRLFYDRALETVSSIPGVEGAALANNLPIEGGVNGGVTIEGKTYAASAGPVAEKRIVSANYFQLIGARLAAGRFFDARDRAGAPPVLVVNESFARRWFPGEDPIGKRADFGWDTEGMQTIVGVVRDVREGALDQPINPAIYISVHQRSIDGMYLLVRSSGDARSLVNAVRQRIGRVDADLPLSDVRTLSDVIASGVSGQAITASVLATFAALALTLAAVGLYGVISYAVVQRKQELGIRAALGAKHADLLGLVLRQGAAFVGLGLAIGVGAALGFARFLAGQLYGIGPTDPLTFAAVALLLATVAMVATAVPALRATRADPLEVLREA